VFPNSVERATAFALFSEDEGLAAQRTTEAEQERADAIMIV